jgi:hypothetical protein
MTLEEKLFSRRKFNPKATEQVPFSPFSVQPAFASVVITELTYKFSGSFSLEDMRQDYRIVQRSRARITPEIGDYPCRDSGCGLKGLKFVQLCAV